MSRSIHQTVKSVYGGKSKREIDDMIKNDDHDVDQLAKKGLLKKRVIDKHGNFIDDTDQDNQVHDIPNSDQ